MNCRPPGTLRVVVADDNPVVRAGLTALLTAGPGVEVVAEATDGRSACEAVTTGRPDVVLLDVAMRGGDGLTVLPYLVRLAPVLMLTYSREREVVREAVRRGAGGYLVHGEFSAERLVSAVREVAAGRSAFTPSAARALREEDEGFALRSQFSTSQLQPDVGQSYRGPAGCRRFGLSRREQEVMGLIAGGMSNQQIAATCFISEKTVKNHINRIFGKLGAGSRSQAIALWLGTARGPAG